MRTLVWGELLWDRFPDGARLGGAPANVAWHLAQLGGDVALVTRVGDDDDGHAAIAAMAARGVDTSLVQLDRERATGEVGVHVEGGEPRYTLYRGRAWERIELTDGVRAALVTARAIVFGTLAQREDAGREALAATLALASPRVLRVCDPNLRGTPAAGERRALEQALAVADVVKVGEREVAQIAALTGRADVVGWLLARGARLVAVTRGADGSRWYAPGLAPMDVAPVAARPDGVTRSARAAPGQSPADGEAGGDPTGSGERDNVGCGDAYTAALVHGLLQGWPWSRIARVASRWGAEVASVRGATPIIDAATRDAILAELA